MEDPSSLNPIRDNPYWIVGVLLLVANVIPGIVLFAFVASLIGEQELEGTGGLSWLGAALVYLPPAVGLTLVLFGRPLGRGPLSPHRLWTPVALIVFGIAGTVIGAVGVTSGVTSGDANIGAGLLLLFCPFVAVMATAWAIWAIRNTEAV